MVRTFSLLGSLLLAAAPSRARAEEPSAAERAEALFKQGLHDLDAGRTKEGCGKFRESMRLDPANGTLMNLARCHELEGRPQEAWSVYREAAARSRAAGQLERAKVADASAARVGAQLPRLRIVVEDAPPGMTIAANGQPVRGSMVSETFVVAPGRVRIAVSAPGRAPYETTVNVPSSRQVSELVVPPLEHDAKAHGPIFWTGIAMGAVSVSSLVAGAGAGAALLADPRAPDAQPKERAAIALVSMGAALGVSASVMIALDRAGEGPSQRAAAAPAVRLGASVEPGGGRATLAFAF